jgi:excisionase family DNA binding protein
VPDEFLTVYEVAGLLKVNQMTVRNWIDQGSLPAVRVGRRVRIRREDFDVFTARRIATPAVQPSAPLSTPELWAEF